MKSEFLDRCKYFYLRINGKYMFPNSCEGDMIKLAQKEIRLLQHQLIKAQDMNETAKRNIHEK